MVGVRFIRWPHNESNFVKTESVIGVGQLVSRKAISLSAARNKRVGLQKDRNRRWNALLSMFHLDDCFFCVFI